MKGFCFQDLGSLEIGSAKNKNSKNAISSLLILIMHANKALCSLNYVTQIEIKLSVWSVQMNTKKNLNAFHRLDCCMTRDFSKLERYQFDTFEVGKLRTGLSFCHPQWRQTFYNPEMFFVYIHFMLIIELHWLGKCQNGNASGSSLC